MKAVFPTGSLSLQGLIDYHGGAIVSQEVLRTPGGTVTLLLHSIGLMGANSDISMPAFSGSMFLG